MKLLYLRNGPYKPQIYNYNLQEIGLCKAFPTYDWNCDILYFSDIDKNECIFENKQRQTTVNILWRKGWKICRTGIYPSLLKRTFLNQYDLIITTEYSQLMSVIICFFSKKVILYTGPYYNLFKIPVVSWFYDKLFVNFLNAHIKHIFCKSQLALEYLKRKGFLNLSVLGVGLDSSKFEFVKIEPSTKSLREILLNNDCLLFVGSLDKRKNFPFLLRIFRRVKNLTFGKDLKLVLIGNGKDSFVNRCFLELPENVRKDVIHIKQIHNAQLKFVYPYAKALLLPSKQEIFGMVLLESMFFGCVPITTKNGGSATLIKNGENGFIVDSFDKIKWISVIKKILSDEEKRLYMSETAQKTIVEKFLWNELAQKILKEYEKHQ